MNGFKIDANDTLTPFLSRLKGQIKDSTEVNEYIAGREEQLFRAYVGGQAKRRHATANRLGARPTGHLERAANSIEGTATAESAIISFPRSTGLSRAFSSYTLVPKNGSKYLTIPVHPSAYGKRAGEFKDLSVLRVGVRNTLILARKVEGREILETLYVLVKSVKIKQDRSLLPSDDQILQTAEVGVRDFIKNLDTTS